MLTDEQKVAIRDYSVDGYQRLNKSLREGKVSAPTRKKIELLLSALAALPGYRGDVYRGVRITNGNSLRRYKTGAIVKEPAFVSTSRSPLKAFSGNVRFYGQLSNRQVDRNVVGTSRRRRGPLSRGHPV